MFRSITSMVLLLLMAKYAAAQSQSSIGDCSPNVSTTTGDVTIGDCVVRKDDVADGRAGIPALFKETYLNARTTLVSEGWLPREIKWNQRHDGPCIMFCEEVATSFPEVIACAPTGYAECRFEFRDATGRVLVVVTRGESVDNLIVKRCGWRTDQKCCVFSFGSVSLDFN